MDGESVREDTKEQHVTRKTFTLMARVDTDNPGAIRPVLDDLLSKPSITPTEGGFLIKMTMRGEGARELNRAFLSALRRVERKTRLRSEWTSGGVTEQFFDYVPKGSTKRKAHVK